MVDKKSNWCTMGVEAGPLLLLREGGFSELQITERKIEEKVNCNIGIQCVHC
jgi:hypothetical protein